MMLIYVGKCALSMAIAILKFSLLAQGVRQSV